MSNQPDEIQIQLAPEPIVADVRPPGSKSITNRALICAALAEGKSELHGTLDSEDTRVMIEGLHMLGIDIEVREEGKLLRVIGCGGKIPAESANIYVENSGTTIRFLTALVSLGSGSYVLDGIPRMRKRPIGDLAEALNQLGARITCESPDGCPPVAVVADGLEGGEVSIRGDLSSQFLSGLLMATPYARIPVKIAIQGALVSEPYVVMTESVMRSFGVSVARVQNNSLFEVPVSANYRGCRYDVEPDASAASYFWAAAAITGGRVTVVGLNRNSLQGDVRFVECLQQMGCTVEYAKDGITVSGDELHGIDVDMNDISDTVQSLAVVALFATGVTRIRNVAHIRHKETDRIGAVATELRKLGARVTEFADGLEIQPEEQIGASIDTYNDHRMAMSFALAGLRIPDVVIRDPGCTAKTYPNFFGDLDQIL